MVNSIIKDIDMDECGEHNNKDLGVSSLFDLARVSILQVSFCFPLYFFLYYNHHSFVVYGKDEGPSG